MTFSKKIICICRICFQTEWHEEQLHIVPKAFKITPKCKVTVTIFATLEEMVGIMPVSGFNRIFVARHVELNKCLLLKRTCFSVLRTGNKYSFTLGLCNPV